MLERVDRVQLVVKDRASAARVFHDILGAEPVGESESGYLAARRTVLALGESEVELCEPAGTGPARAHLERWGEGLMTSGFAVADLGALRRRWEASDVRFTEDGEQCYLPVSETAGMPVVVSPLRQRRRVGLATHLYEVTNTILSDWRARPGGMRGYSASTPPASRRSRASASAMWAPSRSSIRRDGWTASRSPR